MLAWLSLPGWLLAAVMPSPVVPEVPYAALIPLLAIAIGGAVLYRRSRRDD